MTRQQARTIAVEMVEAGYRFVCVLSADRANPNAWETTARNRQTGETVTISTPQEWQEVKVSNANQ